MHLDSSTRLGLDRACETHWSEQRLIVILVYWHMGLMRICVTLDGGFAVDLCTSPHKVLHSDKREIPLGRRRR
jgi:hypothetical protein